MKIYMKKLTLRIDDYTYNLLKEMKKFLGYSSLNKLNLELIEIGYLSKEKEIRNSRKVL